MAPFFITLLLGVGFMALLVMGAVALVRGLNRSQTPGPQRLLGGLLGTVFLALFGIVGSGILVGTLAVMGGALLLEHGPVRSIEVLRLDQGHGMHTRGMNPVQAAARTLDEDAEQAYLAVTAGLDPEYPLHVLVEYQGEVRVAKLQRWLERETHGDVVLVEARPVIREGEERTVLDFGLDVTQRELEHFEREFEEAQPFFDLPHGVRVLTRYYARLGPMGKGADVPGAAQWLPADTFQGEVVLVTGGGTGLGLEISRGFAALGATVVIASRSLDHHAAFLQEARGRGWNAEGLQLDVREAPAVRRVIEGVVERHGRLHHLVNNAAGNFVCPTERLSTNAWRSVLGIVLDGTFHCSKYAGRHMLKEGGGTMLNVVATYAWTGMPGVAHSASAKAGVLALTRSLAAEWAGRGVRVNAVAPGPFHSQGAQRNLWPDARAEEAIRSSIPLGRFATREEVAAQCLYLCSPAAAYITGECLVVDGGLSLGAGRLFEPGARVRRAQRQRESGPEPGPEQGPAPGPEQGSATGPVPSPEPGAAP